MAVVGASHRVPGVPRDLEDDERDHEPDYWVGGAESRCDEPCTCDHPERNETVDPRVIAVGDQRWALKPLPRTLPDLRGDPVSYKADRSCRREQPKVRQRARID